MSILEGMKCVKRAHHEKIISYSDCSAATELLQRQEIKTDLYFDVFHKCNELRHSFQELNVKFTRRENNLLRIV